ncbi:uncharacterized protein (TIGR02246 family) [Rivibacter subsaxonicus]|uniref:Uncharacterized protein (TIGR02246 family) n=2 Tax=Rivibacter subsaxonicus TaxID=457575 RepID=A0A4Q7VW60_9BURK|nr:uncharacterized protein (TIGR02246 family) [Rivibacter subsaxonicus]
MNKQVSGRFGGVVGTVLLAAFLLSGAPGCAVAPQDSAASATVSRDAVAAAAAKWTAVFVDDNPDVILALYDDDGILWGTLSPTIAVGKPAIRGYFERAFKALPGHKVTFGEQKIRIYGDTAINSGYYTFSYVRDGETKTLPARYSFVYRKRGNDWLIVDHHSSAMPPPPR